MVPHHRCAKQEVNGLRVHVRSLKFAYRAGLLVYTDVECEWVHD